MQAQVVVPVNGVNHKDTPLHLKHIIDASPARSCIKITISSGLPSLLAPRRLFIPSFFIYFFYLLPIYGIYLFILFKENPISIANYYERMYPKFVSHRSLSIV